MADIVLWLEKPGNDPIKVIVDDSGSLSGLRTHLAENALFPNFRSTRSLSEYQIVSRKTGLVLRDEDSPLSSLFSNNDHISILEDHTIISPERKSADVIQTGSPMTPQQNAASVKNILDRDRVTKSSSTDPTLLSIAAINPIFRILMLNSRCLLY
jgi:hypothetical protein